MKRVAAIASFVFLTSSALIAQQAAPKKAPPGCITCEQMCNWCISTGKQKGDAAACHSGCRKWGGMVGLSTVYVKKNSSLCGTGNYAPRCN